MNALAGTRLTTATLPLHPHVLLSGSERIMEGPFGIVTQNLLSLGSCPIENLANSPKADLEGFDLPYVSPQLDIPPNSSQPPPEAGSVFSDEKERTSDSMQFVAQLHQCCLQTFGNYEGLKFEFIEEDGPDHKQCILTITRPNGMTRSYKTVPEFSRKSDAKARVAGIAVEMGAVDFILYGNKDNSKSRSTLVLAPLDGKMVKQDVKVKEESPVIDLTDDESSKQIQDCCVEWRAGLVQPRWIFFTENKASSAFGCALVVELSPHSQRVYSVSATYDTKSLAKKEGSEAAIREGVLDFIKFGNGQTEPATALAETLDNASIKREPEFEKKGRSNPVSLQTFFDSLPKPFPENITEKLVSNLNAPGILNTTLQLAKGARLNLQFYFINENGLHGCIIRLTRPGETKTYISDPKFSKRADAKAAVCFLAISQGINQYIRSVAIGVENRITTEMRKKANEQILPILGSEYARLRHGMHPTYEYAHDEGAFGCTMTLALSDDPQLDEMRKWSVPTEYRTKTDAKIAVVYLAGQEAIEFLRFHGEPIPLDHDPFKPYRRTVQNAEKGKKEVTSPVRSSTATEQRSNITKRPVLSTSGLVKLGLQIPETKEGAMTRQREETISTRWTHDRYQGINQFSKPSKGQPSITRYLPPLAPTQPIAGPSEPPHPPCSQPPQRAGPYNDVLAAATAVIDRLTNSSVTAMTTAAAVSPSQHPQPPQCSPSPPSQHSPRAPPSPQHSPPRPPPALKHAPRAPRNYSQPPPPPPSVAPPPPPYTQHPGPQPRTYQKRPRAPLPPRAPHRTSQPLIPQQPLTPQQPSPFSVPPPPQYHPPQPSPFQPPQHQSPQQFSLYGALPQPHSPQPPQLPQSQQHPYGTNSYAPGFAQATYPFPVQQLPSYPPPANAYAIPATPPSTPGFGVAAYPAYAAYYTDPRYAHYSMAMPYAVPMPPTPGFSYPTPPATAVSPGQWGPPAPAPAPAPATPAPATPTPETPVPGPSPAAPAAPTSIVVPPVNPVGQTEKAGSPTRTASFSAGSDRQKRPRSRERSPEDAQQHKKQRSESSLPPQAVSVKRESSSASPAPPTFVPASNATSSVGQLIKFCGSEGIPYPDFGAKQMKNEHGEDVYKVWIVMGKERLELPSVFSSENEGRQRVAKQVLQRLRSQSRVTEII